MTRLQDQLSAQGVYNASGFYNGEEPRGRVFISWTPAQGRSPIGRYWTVRRKGYRTDANSRVWYAHGNKLFEGFGDKAELLEQAKAWASGRYGINDWARDPFGCYGDAEFVKARIAELRAAGVGR